MIKSEMMRHIFTTILILFIVEGGSLPAFSQNLFFEKINGLSTTPNTPVHGITKDSLGYIWFGTWNGLYRYNGIDFKSFRNSPKDTHSIPINRIRNIITDKNRQLWIFTFNNQYLRLNYETDNFHIVPDSLLPSEVIQLFNKNCNELNNDKLINNKRYQLVSHHLASFNIKTGKTYKYKSDLHKPGGLTDDYITSFYIDDQKIIWLGTRKGNIYMANTNWQSFKLYHNYIEKNQKPFPTSVRVILKDDENLWLGTNHNGITIRQKSNLYKAHPFYQTNYEEIQPRSMLKDKNGNIWLGTTSGLQCFKPESGELIDFINREKKPGLEIWSVYSIVKSSKNRIWVGLYNALGKIELTSERVSVLNFPELIGNHSVMHVLEDRRNNVWLATEGNGVICLKFDQNENCTDTLIFNTSSKQQLCGNLVYSLYEDDHDQIWTGTSDGLSCIDVNGLSIKNFTRENGLPEDYISAVTGDHSGNIWVSHKMGISKINTEDFKIQNYSIRDNNDNWVFLDGACFNDSMNNQIYFGARNGFISFIPDSIKSSTISPDLVLASLSIAGRDVVPGDTIDGEIVLQKALSKTEAISLKHGQNSFSIKMDALYYPDMAGMNYFYCLVGYDDDVRESHSNIVSYVKVPAGDYIFEAESISPEGNWSATKKLKIKILPPWYATIWAYTGYIIFMGIILFVIYRIVISRERLKNQINVERLKLEKHEELNKAKLEFFTNVSHEFRTPLTLISDPLKQLMRNEKTDKEKYKLYLGIIHRNVMQLSHLITQLLDFRKAEVGKLAPQLEVHDGNEIIKAAFNAFCPMAEEREIQLNFTGFGESLYGYFDKEKLKQIMENLLSNAFKYTPDKGQIGVHIEKGENNERLVIFVKDSGIGVVSDNLKKIFEPFNQIATQPFYGSSSGIGMAFTKKLVEVLGGDISIQSTPQKGTEVIVSLPFKPVTFDEASLGKISRELNTENLQNAISGKCRERDSKGSKPLILIVEDSKDIQTYLKAELDEKYEIITRDEGLGGYKTAVSKLPDLIISDVMMPGMDGNKFCKKIKGNEHTCHIPVVLLTAKITDANRIEGLQSGADVYISKPFNIDVLKAQIESVIENRLRLQKNRAKEKKISELTKEETVIDHRFLNKAISIVESNLDKEGFNPQKLATNLNISQRQLYRKLKAVTGSTAHEFIVRVRMEKASGLLLNSDLNISEIAFKVGFNEPSNFSRTFSKHYGLSPTKYIQKKSNS